MQNLKIGRDGRSYVARVELPEGASIKGRDFTHIRVEVTYVKGGVNYLSGNHNPRGYRIDVRPVTYKGDGWESFIPLGGKRESGGYVMLAEALRFSARTLEFWAQRIDPPGAADSGGVLQGRHQGVPEALRKGEQ